MRPSRVAPVSILNRYLLRQFFTIFFAVIIAFVLLYLIVDFFERLGLLLRLHAPPGATVRYFLFKIPLMVTQVTPAAVLTATLISLGLLSRNNEIIALRATGVSLTQMAGPLISVATAISLGCLLWNETVVPYCTQQFEYVNSVEIRKRELRGILADRGIWYHGKNGFYSIEHVDKDRKAIYGLVVYSLDEAFHLERVTSAPKAEWLDNHWQASGGVTRRIDGDDFTNEPLNPDQLPITETIADFLDVQRKPEELSFLRLRDWIANLTSKGIDASRYQVDLHMKLAVPFASAVLTIVAVPIAGSVRRHPSIARIVTAGTVIGFCYWVTLALANSLGYSSTLPPILAAWAANILFTLVGTVFFLSNE